MRDWISSTVVGRGGRSSRTYSRGWACTSGNKRGRRNQDKASRPGQRTGRRGQEKVKSNYLLDVLKLKILSAKVKYIFHLKMKPK